jgi:DNA polymerase elongation subunit (family B)
MIDKVDIFKILFIDIETVPITPVFEDLPDHFKPLWAKKAQRISNPDNLEPEQLFDRAGIYSEFGKIVCISAGFFRIEEEQLTFRVKSFYGHDEKELLLEFAELLNEHFNTDKHSLCAHNGKEFDFPYISRRMLVHSIPLPSMLNNFGKKPWEVNLLDTMDMWRFGDYKSYTSLELLAALFDIPTPKDDISGADIHRVYWQENDLERIAIYCSKDVVTIARLFMKYLRIGILEEENVYYF